jgi:hypothetical protein
MHAMSPSQLILLDFATLTLCGEQCILLQHSVHFQLQQVRKRTTHCATCHNPPLLFNKPVNHETEQCSSSDVCFIALCKYNVAIVFVQF